LFPAQPEVSLSIFALSPFLLSSCVFLRSQPHTRPASRPPPPLSIWLGEPPNPIGERLSCVPPTLPPPLSCNTPQNELVSSKTSTPSKPWLFFSGVRGFRYQYQSRRCCFYCRSIAIWSTHSRSVSPVLAFPKEPRF